MTAETSQTLDRGLRVLKLLADTDHGLTVTELSNKLGVNRTVVYRLLATLEQHALVRRDLGGRARVGLGVLRLGRQVHPLVREAAMPALRSLAEDIGATAHLTLVDGAEALAVAVVEPTWTDYHVAYRAGFRHPLDRGAAGKAILAARQSRQNQQNKQGKQGKQGGLDEPGYTLTHGELEAGASGAAAALVGVTGIEGSVGVVMLADSVPERVGPRVVDAAREVADALR
ncbi:helix-turn-helix domain-containing protein [Streptomyces lunaelactis]|uniref:IclR family transcriptional regulator n=1 Tax=Streptomyces lunaelactis TaxID=1535768 RepID=UPI0015849C0E|nr:helix-turn-helix domain-containing protein [Streptomyces lunaelactis]NUK39129.1 helix-turn-helix domain-containing protein [Streptomyces lunaelactis]NUK46268.1 helix-turn-helix domain-containing protein [Streptomyces lunaelactis]NUK97041.1 helix-turn-helix domain-containing protein [Streptomyces lunaelactis]NUL33886.1 helix-turn-helix domain-containing protein [Streptomyces lunaelactis]